jgi:hypothetical protein
MEGVLEISKERPQWCVFFLGRESLDLCRHLAEFFSPDIRCARTNGVHRTLYCIKVAGIKACDRQLDFRFRVGDKKVDHFHDQFVTPEPAEPIQRFQVDLRYAGDSALLRRIWPPNYYRTD